MSSSLNTEQKYALVTRRLELQNGGTGQQLLNLLSQRLTLKYQWVTAPTGKPHLGYFVPFLKFADFIRTGGEIVIEITDTYAFLVNYRFPWEQVQHRATYYRCLITAALKAIGVPLSKVQFVQASSYQGNRDFCVDFWKLCALCSQQDVRDTGTEVGSSTMLSPLLTPLLHELAEEYSGIDVQLGGKDQRGIFNLGEQFLPQLGYDKRAHLLNELLPSLTGGKMSSSHPPHTKLMFLDNDATIMEKIAAASCPVGAVDSNGILPIVEHILIPISEFRLNWAAEAEVSGCCEVHNANGKNTIISTFFGAESAPRGTVFSVSTPDAVHPLRHYSSYEELEQDYISQRVSPESLKESVVSNLLHVLGSIRQSYEDSEEWRRSDRLGYPEDWTTPSAAEGE